jgi:NADPH-dependent curcumin reductase CurA
MPMYPIKNREVHLISRPKGIPKKSNFAVVEANIPPLKKGQILIKNHYFSVDPYMRGRMNDGKSYIPPFQLNQPMSGGSVGEVIESKHPDFEKGQITTGFGGWREYFVSDGAGLRIVDTKLAPIRNYLSILGLTGLTAYIGLFEIAQLKENETVFVSAAAGAVGSIACQLAKLHGCTVIGSAGSDKKIRWLKEELGVDEAINYRSTDNMSAEIGKLCPEGIDVYFDNVGGTTLDAALVNTKAKGRVAICGMISQYNKEIPDPIYNLSLAISKRLKIEGFLVGDHNDKAKGFLNKIGRWLAERKIKQEETIIEGIKNSVNAFLGLFSGDNMGKMLVKL